MTKLDPIIAVKDVEASSRWYQAVFGCRSKHGGKEFDILVTESGEVLLCLHQWGTDEHPSMLDASIAPGNGLILYLRTGNMREIREKARKAGVPVAEDIHLNPNSRRMEFSLRDPDGYYLTITEHHEYEG